jgi:hypothetical protein
VVEVFEKLSWRGCSRVAVFTVGLQLIPLTVSWKTVNRILADELGPDVVRHLHRAFKLTAAALYRRAVEQAEAQLQQASDEPK